MEPNTDRELTFFELVQNILHSTNEPLNDCVLTTEQIESLYETDEKEQHE